MKNISLFGQKFEPLVLAVVSICVISLIFLGNWQLKRLHEKENFIAKIEANIQNPPVKITSEHNKLEPYSKVEVKGRFLNDRNIFLYGRRSAYPEKDGYYFLSPFEDVFGNVYLVSRAWIPQSAKEKANSFDSLPGESITAFVMPGEEKGSMIPDNDMKNNIWFTLDLNEAKDKFALTNKDFYLMQENSTNLPEGALPLTSKYLNVVRNDHLEYAITWYSLAGFLCVIYLVYNRKRG